MYEIIHYANLTLKLILTPYGMVALLIFFGIYAVYLFTIQRIHVNVLAFVKLIAYPFMFTYGLIMLVVARLLEKDTVQRLGLCIMLIPIIIAYLTSIIKEEKPPKESEP